MAGDRPHHRLFFALVPPAPVLARIERVAADLQRRQPARGRSTRPEQMHLTLAFLGDFDDAGVPERARLAGARVRADRQPHG